MAFAFRPTEHVALALGAATGSLVYAALPITVGAVITVFGDAAKGGLAATAELTAMALVSLVFSSFLRFLPGRATALVSALTIIAGYALSSFAVQHVSWSLLLVARVLVGAGEGGLYTISNAFAGKSTRPGTAFTLIAFAQTTMNALFFIAMTVVNSNYDPVRVFIVFGVVAVLGSLGLFFGPSQRTGADAAEQYSDKVERFSPSVIRVLVAFGLYSAALFILFPYVDDIGVNSGFTHAQVSAILTLSSFAAVCGPLITATLGLRLGWVVPIVVAIALQLIASLILVYCHVLTIWGAAELISIAMLYVLTPLMFSFAAHIERSGRATAFATGIMALTAAGGSALASFVMAQTSSYVTLGWCNAIVYLLMGIAVWAPLRAADRAATRAKVQLAT